MVSSGAWLTRLLDHCLDYLRQVVQCQSDLTPLTYEPYEPKNTSIPVFGTPHTCRNFTKIHEWAMENKALDWNASMKNS